MAAAASRATARRRKAGAAKVLTVQPALRTCAAAHTPPPALLARCASLPSLPATAYVTRTASCAACSSLQHLAPSVAANADAQPVRAWWRNTRRARPLTHALRAAREHARRAAGRACRAPRSLAWRGGAEALFRRTQLAAHGRVRRAAAAEPHHRDTCNRPPVSAVCVLDAAPLQQLTRAHAGTCCVRFAPCRRRTALLAR
jgi:hypothetical protein